jgi:hypothetical protein
MRRRPRGRASERPLGEELLAQASQILHWNGRGRPLGELEHRVVEAHDAAGQHLGYRPQQLVGAEVALDEARVEVALAEEGAAGKP